ncbi:hypothetical protein H8I91_09390 [Serratia fonticola]|uniref:hypothetical protein n=1 Tax=Serratia fonticola TaxID=47917 RepID=UPI001644C2CD|nr:hypothetical protein [Serratia fonticola]MBC3250475.1 hypothetical protein [Serratia fonticola]
MKELDNFTVERLERIAERTSGIMPTMREISALARIALAVKTAEESHSRREVWDGGNTWVQCSKQAYDRHEAAGKRVRVLYEKMVLPNYPELPDGWVMVPLCPDENMLQAWRKDMAQSYAGVHAEEIGEDEVCFAYQAMLAAAPTTEK